MNDQTLKTAQSLFNAKRYAEAIPLFQSAAEIYPQDEGVWQKLALAASLSGQHEQAVKFTKQGLRYHPHSDWLWRHLGNELISLDFLEDAETALDTAKNLDPDYAWLWRYYLKLYQKQKNESKELEALEKIDALGEADADDLNQLGIAYLNKGHFTKAIESYRRSVEIAPDSTPYFNMGLAFTNPEVSQDVDAADAYLRALALNPNHARSKERLELTKQKLLPLAKHARETASELIEKDEYFQFYLSPFEALQMKNLNELSEVDTKSIQRAKKTLLQEIDLNDGKVGWLNDYALDKSRALALEDELHDETKRKYHWAIFTNQRLLHFLTRSDIEHFLYSEDYFPIKTLKLIDNEPEFLAFLSKLFARQYDLLLSRAIDRHVLSVVEVLFDGRRWVEPKDEDICFEGAFKRVNALVEKMQGFVEEAKKRKVSVQEIQKFFEQNTVIALFNLLPTAFRLAQSKLVEKIRSVAIACNNEHTDSELSLQILELCKQFHFKSVDLNKALEKDFKIIESNVRDQKSNQQQKPAPSKKNGGMDFVVDSNGVCQKNQKTSNEKTRTQKNQPQKKQGLFGYLLAGPFCALVKILPGTYQTAMRYLLAGAFCAVILLFVGCFIDYQEKHRMSSHVRNHRTTAHDFKTQSSSSLKTVYSVTGNMKAELERDGQEIEAQKNKSERMEVKLKKLAHDIEQQRLYLDQTSQSSVDAFNSDVSNYNDLLEQVRRQNRLVNKLVDNYNRKLQKYGR